MVCGLGSRHYLDLRRRERRLHETSEEANPAELSSPEIWDVSIMPGEEKWKALMVGSILMLFLVVLLVYFSLIFYSRCPWKYSATGHLRR